MREPQWIELSTVLAVHDRLLAEHGGLAGVRDENLLESALGKPRNLLAYGNPTFAEMAAAYAYGIARNHPFLDGNKRTAYAVSRLFLRINGTDILATKEEKYLTFLALGEGRLSEVELVQWFETHTAQS